MSPAAAASRISAVVALLAVATVLLAALARAAPAPVTAAKPAGAPKLDALSWAMLDARSGEFLVTDDADRRLPMASTTKMMTAYLALKRLPMGKRVRAPDYRGDPVESLMGLEPGQLVSVRDLLYGLIMLSGNDAAYTLAQAVSGSQQAFVAEMNRTAARLGLGETHYANPIGLDEPGHYSSARDLAVLGRELMRVPAFRRIATARTAELTSYSPPRRIETTNSFLVLFPWAHGIKTGHTLKAGYVLTSEGRRRGAELIAAVVGAPTEEARNTESAELLEHGFSLYTKRVPLRKGKVEAKASIEFGRGELPLRAVRSVAVGVRRGQDLRLTVAAPEEVDGPIRRGQRLGRVTIRLDGRRYAVVPLAAARAVEEASTADKATYYLGRPWVWLPLAVFAILLSAVAVRGVRRRREAEIRRRMRRMRRRR